MPISLHTFSVQAITSPTGDIHLQNIGVQVAALESGGTNLYSYGVQVMTGALGGFELHTVGVQVSFRASRSHDGGYVHPSLLEDIEEEDMIYSDIIFPECISYGSTGVPRYLTDKAEVLSGNEQRQTRYEYPRHEYSINMENVPAPEIAEIMNIWHVVSGDYAGFLFLDPLDHTSGNTETNFSATEVTPTDQEIASASGDITEYPLYKFYEKGSRRKRRRIKYPKVDTMRVAVNGVETTRWEWDNNTFKLRFTSILSAGTVATATKVGNALTTTGTSPFFNMAVGDTFYISGFTDELTDTASGMPLRIVTRPTGASITVEAFDGADWGDWGGTDEADVEVTLNPAYPSTGDSITAGYWFYVPVRFDEGDNAMSEIQNGLRETSVANFTNIKLREIFE